MPTTTHMSLQLPTVSVTLGPTWATYLNTALETIDSHDHSSGKGTRVTPAGLNINADLEMNGNDLTEVRSIRLENHSGSLVGASDLGAVYAYAGNLYYNNSSGTPIQLTSGGGLNSAGLVANVHTQTVVAGTHTIQANDTYVTLKVNTTAARTINLPAISGVTQGRYYIFQDISGQSETNPITLVRNGSDTIEGAGANFTLSLDNGVWWIESDGVSNWKVTRATPDFLTKDSLTLGSTVLNTSSLTVGGNTLSSSTLTIPSGYLSLGTNPAGSGLIRLPNLQNIVGRNAANSSDITIIGVNASDFVSIGGGASAISFNNGSGHLVAGSQVLTTYLSFDQNVATGYLRLPNDGAIVARDNANVTDKLLIKLTNANMVEIGGKVRYTSPYQPFSRLQRAPMGDFGYSQSGTWTISGYAGLLIWANTATTGAQRDIFIVDPPHGATLDTITMYYNIGGSSRTPGTYRLGIYCYRVPFDGTMLGSASDSNSLLAGSTLSAAVPAQVAAYSFPASYTSHTFTCDTTGNVNVIDNENYVYVVRIQSESGAGADGTVNSVRGFKFNYTLRNVGHA